MLAKYLNNKHLSHLLYRLPIDMHISINMYLFIFLAAFFLSSSFLKKYLPPMWGSKLMIPKLRVTGFTD